MCADSFFAFFPWQHVKYDDKTTNFTLQVATHFAFVNFAFVNFSIQTNLSLHFRD